MKNATLGDFPNVPEGLKDLNQKTQDRLNEDPIKRSGKLKAVRHKVKELLKQIIK